MTKDDLINRGFPEYALRDRDSLIDLSRSAFHLSVHIERYFWENDIKAETLTYDDVVTMARDYISKNIPAQFVDEDGDNWYDQTYELWIEAFVVYIAFYFLSPRDKYGYAI